MTRALGFCSRTGAAVAVAIDDVTLVGRWVLDLTEGLVPGQVFHAAAGLPLPEAETLVRRTVETVTALAKRRMNELVTEVGVVDLVGVVMGDHPVPESIPAILASHPLMHAAEGQLYRDALLDAAAASGLRAVGLPRSQVTDQLAGELAGLIQAVGAAAGPPWRKEHKLAAAAALAAGHT